MRKFLPFWVVLLGTTGSAVAQCSTGFTSASLNWDALDYLAASGYSANQYFAFGKNRLNVQYTTTSPNVVSTAGENAAHTGESGSYGSGEDVQFTGNGTITLTFSQEVTGLKFSLYDIDKKQRVQLGARNAAGTSLPIDITTLGASILTLTGDGGTAPAVADNTGSGANAGTSVGTASTNASINVDIAGPVKTVTITVSNTGTVNGGPDAEDGSYWLSDLFACSPGAFPLNYHQVSRPLAGQPGYVLESINNSVYYVDPATGNAKLLFTDGATSAIITSMAYDPYNHAVYYVYGLVNNGASPASSNKSLMKYDLNTGMVTTLVQDITTLGIPTYDQGVENGGACFYDGAWYIGIEGGTDRIGGRPGTTGKESVVWRLDLNSSGVPVSATQVFGVSGDTNDWGDFTIHNGTLYNFNGDPVAAAYNHYDLQTGTNQTVPSVGTAPSQCAVGWDGTIYWLDSTVATYNRDGSLGAQKKVVSTPGIGNWSNYGRPLFTDGGEAFRPPYDFGDAPDSYDPDPLAPAMHELSANLRLGPVADWEWAKTPSSNATADGTDEDGLTFVRIYVNGANYQTDLRVYNNTGSNATVCAWLDHNTNGVFDAGEGVSYTVPSSTSTQAVQLFWNAPTSLLTDYSNTYLRVRITSAAYGMTVANPTGFYLDGEVEDYYVVVSSTPLSVKLTDFSARKEGEEKVSLTWTVSDEEPNTRYEVQKSGDGKSWAPLYTVRAGAKRQEAQYGVEDGAPFTGTTYYRLKITAEGEAALFSDIKKVVLSSLMQLGIVPNPASSQATFVVHSVSRTTARLRVVDVGGRVAWEKDYRLEKGANQFAVPLSGLPRGVYQAEWLVGPERYTRALLVRD